MRSSHWVKYLAVALFLVFAGAGLSENFIHHHHDKTEDSDCAYCGFHKAINNSDFSTTPIVHLIPLFFLFFAALVFLPSYASVRFLLHSGRAPPAVLS